MYQTNLRYHRN